jgi:hypothetical protein
VWREDVSRALLPSITIHPRAAGHELWVETRVFLEGGRTITMPEDGPYFGAAGAFDVAVPLPPEIGERFAVIWVLVTAIDPGTRQTAGHKGTTVAAHRDSAGVVRLLREDDAVQRTRDVGVEQDGFVEDGLVGREVVP